MTEERWGPGDLDDLEQELLTMLLPSSLREKVIASRVTTEELTRPQLTRRLRSLAKRGLVALIPAPWGSIWCLTATGRVIAEGLRFQEKTINQHRQLTMFEGEEQTS